MVAPDPSYILGAGVLALVLLFVLFGFRPRRRILRPKALDEIGRRLRGKLETSDGEPAVLFTWHGDKAILRDGEESTLIIHSDRLRKPRASLISGFTDSKVGTGVVIGGVSGFNVSGGEIGEVAEFLSLPVRRLLQDLQLLRHDARLTVELGPSFKVNIKPAVKSEDLARFVMLSLQLAEHARLFAQRDAGVTFVRQESLAEGLCQICGTEMIDRVVRCASCSTPHHQECWEYAGVCSTFACKERRFVR